MKAYTPMDVEILFSSNRQQNNTFEQPTIAFNEQALLDVIETKE